MKIFAAGDFHGYFPESFVKFINRSEIDIVLLAGDFYNNDTLRKIIFENWKELHSGETNLKNLLGKNKNGLKKEINSGKEVFSKLSKIKKPIYLVFGNGDYTKGSIKQIGIKFVPLENLIKKYKNIREINRRIVRVNEFFLVGFPYGAKVSKKFKRKLKKSILLSHEPPCNTKLDVVRNYESPRNMEHVGNNSLTRFAKKYKPFLWICGHMHENRGIIKFGKTLVVNSGHGREGECAIIDINKKISAKLLKL